MGEEKGEEGKQRRDRGRGSHCGGEGFMSKLEGGGGGEVGEKKEEGKGEATSKE